MKKPFIIIIVVALGLVGSLYSLPKVVVSDENKKLEQPNKEASMPSANRDKAGDSKEASASVDEKHGSGLTSAQEKVVEELKATFEGSSGKEAKIKAASSLVERYTEYTQYDNAAYYAEEIAKLNPSEENLMKAGNLYYEAFTYSLKEEKTTKMGEKARALFTQILAKNPDNLLAKTNMAMTYVSSSNPMQGILMLREVIAKEPEYEPALFNLGILSIRSNQYAMAVDRFKQLLQINPANSKAALNLGYCLAELDRKEEAKQILEKVLKSSKDIQEKAAAQEILSKLQ